MKINICAKLVVISCILLFASAKCMDNTNREHFDKSTFLSYFMTLSKTAQEAHVTGANQTEYTWYRKNIFTPLIMARPMTMPRIPRAHDNIKLGLNEQKLARALSAITKCVLDDKKFTTYHKHVDAYYYLNVIGSILLGTSLFAAYCSQQMHQKTLKKSYYLCRFFMKQPNRLVKHINCAIINSGSILPYLIAYGVNTLFSSVYTDLEKPPVQSYVNGAKAYLYYIVLDVAQRYAQDMRGAIKKGARQRRRATQIDGAASTANTQKQATLQHSLLPAQAKANVAQKRNTNHSKITIAGLLTAVCKQIPKVMLAMRLATHYETY